MSDNVTRIDSATTGMRHLVEQAHPKTQEQRPPPPALPDQCIKVQILLNGSEYYVPLGSFGMNDQPPFQFQIPVAYSEVRDPNNPTKLAAFSVIAIRRHEMVEIYATGLKTEIVPLPEWWAKRDNGVV